MTLLDANALIALLVGEPGEQEVSELLRRDCAIPAACLAEVVSHLLRKHAVPMEKVRDQLGPLIDESLPVLSAGERVSWRAAAIHADFYDRRKRALSLADCLLLASAKDGDEIATSDRAILEVAGRLGIGVIPLPDSSGRRPELD